MNDLIQFFLAYRVMWIAGRLGGGKTSLAVVIAMELLNAGLVDGVITNFPCVLPPSKGPDDGTLWNRVIIFDEAWEQLDARTSMTNSREFGAYTRKFGGFWLFPSVYAIDKRLRAVECRYRHKSLFSNDRVYEARLAQAATGDEDDSIKFKADISRAYGLYATAYVPTDDCGILARFDRTFADITGAEDGYQSQHDRYNDRIRTESGASAKAAE